MVSEVISPGCFGAGLRQAIIVIEACDRESDYLETAREQREEETRGEERKGERKKEGGGGRSPFKGTPLVIFHQPGLVS